jgi:excisionase family DNA binding protein
MNQLNENRQTIIIELFAPIIDTIVDRVSERVLSATAKREPKFYTRKETAGLLHVTLPTLYRLTKDGLLESRQVGARVLYDANAIDTAVRQKVIFKYKRGGRAQADRIKKGGRHV